MFLIKMSHYFQFPHFSLVSAFCNKAEGSDPIYIMALHCKILITSVNQIQSLSVEQQKTQSSFTRQELLCKGKFNLHAMQTKSRHL